MSFQTELKRLQESEVFKQWKKEHQNSYLTYGFIMISSDVKQEWQIGFFSPKKTKITAFTMSKEIVINPDSEIFSEDKKVDELILDDVTISLETAIDTANKLQKEKYSQHKPTKEMIILQKLDVGQVWNITFITQSFKTLNIKIDSKTGKIVKDDLIELFSFEK